MKQLNLEKIKAEFGNRLVTFKDGSLGLSAGLHMESKAVAGDQPIIAYIATDDTVDRYNESILPTAWKNFDNFKRNPVITDCHNYSSVGFVLGRAVRYEVKDGRLENDVLFATANPLGKVAYDMAKAGFLPTQSVGFIPLDWTNGGSNDAPDRTYTECDLLEIALTVVPANPAASNLSKAFAAGALEKSDLRELRGWLKQFCSDENPNPPAPGSDAGEGINASHALVQMKCRLLTSGLAQLLR